MTVDGVVVMGSLSVGGAGCSGGSRVNVGNMKFRWVQLLWMYNIIILQSEDDPQG